MVELTNLKSQVELIQCPEYDGIKWPAFTSFRSKGAENTVKDVMDFQSRESDIMICAYAKSGTHWINEIIKMLLKNSPELEQTSKRSGMLESFTDLSELDAIPSPRVLNTHFPFQYLPRKHIQNRGKIVHITRNPKDVSVSFYYHAQKDNSLDLNYPWNEFFEIWMSGKVPYGSWYDYELGMEKAEKDYPGMIYTCSYEDMKMNPVLEIKKLTHFLEVDCTNQMIDNIAKSTSFDNMQKNKYDSTARWNAGKGIIYRKDGITTSCRSCVLLINDNSIKIYYHSTKKNSCT